VQKINSELTFSIIICNFNYVNFVGDAISSALNQNYHLRKFEVIVVDDGSSDNSKNIISGFNHYKNFRTIFHKKNYGQFAAFKSGIESARHEWICLLDSDDIFLPNKLESLALFINSEKDAGLFLCHDVKIWDHWTGYSEKWFARNFIYQENATINDFSTSYPFTTPCGLIFHTSLINQLLRQISPIDWKRGADNPLVWGAFLINQKISYLHQTLSIYRVHDDNYFMGSGVNYFSPKINPFDRWPKLLKFLENISSQNLDRAIFTANRKKLIVALKKFRSSS
jgi:glycosyltransferase involved in cell wall biosynthesis